MATKNGRLVFALFTLISVGACSTGPTKAQADKIFNDGIAVGRTQSGGQMAPGYGNAPMSGQPTPGAYGPPVRAGQYMVSPVIGAPLWPQGTMISHADCPGIALDFEPKLKGHPQEQSIVFAVKKYACNAGASAVGTIAGHTFYIYPNGR